MVEAPKRISSVQKQGHKGEALTHPCFKYILGQADCQVNFRLTCSLNLFSIYMKQHEEV